MPKIITLTMISFLIMMTFFHKPDFRGFLICVIDRSGVSCGYVANLSETGGAKIVVRVSH